MRDGIHPKYLILSPAHVVTLSRPALPEAVTQLKFVPSATFFTGKQKIVDTEAALTGSTASMPADHNWWQQVA